jgi:hypothetical protein
MADTLHRSDEPPPRLPEDPTEEETRLVKDSISAGIDPNATIDLAHRARALLGSRADALRAVDRRIASGLSLEETEAIVLDTAPPHPFEHHGGEEEEKAGPSLRPPFDGPF